MSYEDAARSLGLHPATLRRAVRAGELRFVQVAGLRSRRIERAELDRWIASHRERAEATDADRRARLKAKRGAPRGKAGADAAKMRRFVGD